MAEVAAERKGWGAVVNYNRKGLQDVPCLEITDRARCTSVQELHLCFNYITEVPAGTLSPYPHLTHLSLSCNNLTSLPVSLATSCPQLQRLRAANNQIVTMENLEGLRNLEYLDLRYNHISQLNNLLTLTALKEFSVSDNKIERVCWCEVPDLPSLTFLGLYGNQLTDFESIIQNLSQRAKYLTHLNIGCNPFTQNRQLSLESVLLLKVGHLNSSQIKELYLKLGGIFTSVTQKVVGESVMAEVQGACYHFTKNTEGYQRLGEMVQMLLKLKAAFPLLRKVDENLLPLHNS